jgi:hypothetical protein
MPATVYTGNETSYTSAVTVIRQLENYIDNFSPKEFPLLSRVGLNSYPDPITNTKVEWQRDSAVPLADALAAAIADGNVTTITLAHAEYFTLNDVILIDSELLLISSINDTANTAVVVRGFAGSTAAAHSNGAAVSRLGVSRPEGSSPGWAQQVAVDQPWNYTHIWDFVVGITGTEEALKNYAPADLLAYRTDARMTEMYQLMEKALWYNAFRYAGSATLGRLSAGLNFFVADKNNLSGAPFTYDDVEDVMQDKFSAFGLANVPDTLWVNAWGKRKVSSWGLATIQTNRAENVVGNEITVIETNFGTLSVELDHLLVPSEAWLLNMDKIMIGPMQGRGFAEYDASVPGDDATRSRVLGEYLFVVKGEDGTNDGLNAKIYGMSLTS